MSKATSTKIPTRSSSAKPAKPKAPFVNYIRTKTSIGSSNGSNPLSRRTSDLFGYSLSSAERRAFVLTDNDDANNDMDNDNGMKKRTDAQRTILHNEQDCSARENYLNVRNEVRPRDKYYYPAATSWRYGWVDSVS